MRNAGGPVQLARQLLRHAAIFLWALLSPKAVLVGRLLAAESHLACFRRPLIKSGLGTPLLLRSVPAFKKAYLWSDEFFGRTADKISNTWTPVISAAKSAIGT